MTGAKAGSEPSAPVTTSTVGEYIRWATDSLARAGVPSPEHDAWALLEHASGLPRAQLLTLQVARADEIHGAARFAGEYVVRRAAREPLQHITGQAHFRHLVLAVGPGVFIPRPETELVAEAAITAAEAVSSHPPVVVDLGTGSGAIAVSVADEVPDARVYAVEADAVAHQWARVNCLGRDIELRLGDMATCCSDLRGAVDVVVSNPPYIPVGAEIRDPEVAAHDPAAALWSGADGLDAIRVVEHVAARLLRSGGTVVVEHADRQGASAPAVFETTGRWLDVQDHRDLAGRDRFLTATLGAAPDHAVGETGTSGRMGRWAGSGATTCPTRSNARRGSSSPPARPDAVS